MEQVFSLKEFGLWVLSGGGAGALAFWLMGQVPFLKALLPDYKRYVAFGLTGVFAVGVWLFFMWMTWVEVPINAQAWVESVLSVIGTAIVTGQVLHGATSLREERLRIVGR